MSRSISYILVSGKKILNRVLRPLDLKIDRINPENDFGRLIFKTLSLHECDLLIDIGANEGQYAQNILDDGYSGHIISFEPLLDAHKKLQNISRRYNNWSVESPVAIGAEQSETLINVSGNSVSSSLLEMEKVHSDAENKSKYVATQHTSVVPLNSYTNKLAAYKNIYLKIDTQGYEMQVLTGLGSVLSKIDFIQLEVSFVELYTGQYLHPHIDDWMGKNGFRIWSIDRGFTDQRSGQTYQADIIYKKTTDV